MLVDILLRRISPGLCARHRSCFLTRVTAWRLQAKSWNSGNYLLRTPSRRNIWSFLERKWKSKDEKDDGRQDQASTDGAISVKPKEGPEAHISNGSNSLALLSPKATQLFGEPEPILARVDEEHLAKIHLPSCQTDTNAATDTSTATISDPGVHDELDKYQQGSTQISSTDPVDTQLIKPVSLHEISMFIRTGSTGFLDPRSVIAGYHQYRCEGPKKRAKRPFVMANWDMIDKHKWIFEVVMIYLAFEPLVIHHTTRPWPLRQFARHSSMTRAIISIGASLQKFIYPICLDLFHPGKHAPDGRKTVTQLLQEHGHWSISNPSHGSTEKTTACSQVKVIPSQSNLPGNGSQSSLIDTMPEPSSNFGDSKGTATSTALLCVISFSDALNILRFGDPSKLHIDSVKAGFWNSYHALALEERASYAKPFRQLLLYLSARPLLRRTLSDVSAEHASEVLASYFSESSTKEIFLHLSWRRALRTSAKIFRDLLIHGKQEDQLTASYILSQVNGQYQNVAVRLPETTKVLKVTTFLEALESLCSGLVEDLDLASVLSGWYHHNNLRRYTLRQTNLEYAECDHYDYLVAYLTLWQPAAILQLTSISDREKFRFVANYCSTWTPARQLRKHRGRTFSLYILCRHIFMSKVGEPSFMSKFLCRTYARCMQARIAHMPVNERYQGSILDQSLALLQSARAGLPDPTLVSLTLEVFLDRNYPFLPQEVCASVCSIGPDLSVLQKYDRMRRTSILLRAIVRSLRRKVKHMLDNAPTPIHLGLLRAHTYALETLWQRIVAGFKPLPTSVTPTDHRDALVSHLSSSSLHPEHGEEKVLELPQTADLFEHSKPAAFDDSQIPLTHNKAIVQSFQPESLKKLLAKGAYLQKGWLAQITPTLAPEQQVQLVEHTIAKLLQRKEQIMNRRDWTLRLRVLSDLVEEAKQLYRLLQLRHNVPMNLRILRRPRNPFTQVVHYTVGNEIRKTKEWHATEAARHKQLISKLRAEGSEETTRKQLLQRQYHASLLKLTTAKKYLEALRMEQKEMIQVQQELRANSKNQLVAGEEESVEETKTHKDHQQGSDVVAQHIFEEGDFEKPALPYRVQHYVMGDIHERFKRAFWAVGQRIFPQLMEEIGWTDAESLSILEIEKIMHQDPDMSLIREAHRRQLQSLRVIRNTHAHESKEVDLQQVIVILADAKDIANSMNQKQLEVHVGNYLRLLQSFRQASLHERDKMQERFLSIQSSLKHQREMALRKLEYRAKRTVRQSELTAEAKRVHSRYSGALSRSLDELRSIFCDRQRILAEGLMRFALESQIRNRLREGEPTWIRDVLQLLCQNYGVALERSSKETHEESTQGETDDLVGDIQSANPVEMHPGTIASHKSRKPSLSGDRSKEKQRTANRSVTPVSDSIQQTDGTLQHSDLFEEKPCFIFLQPSSAKEIRPDTSQTTPSPSRPEDRVQKQGEARTSDVEPKERTDKEATATWVNWNDQTTTGDHLLKLLEPMHHADPRRKLQPELPKPSRLATQQDEYLNMIPRDNRPLQISKSLRNGKPASPMENMATRKEPEDLGPRQSRRYRSVRQRQERVALSAAAALTEMLEARRDIGGEATASADCQSGKTHTTPDSGNTTDRHKRKSFVREPQPSPRDTDWDATDPLSKFSPLINEKRQVHPNRYRNDSAQRMDSATQYKDLASNADMSNIPNPPRFVARKPLYKRVSSKLAAGETISRTKIKKEVEEMERWLQEGAEKAKKEVEREEKMVMWRPGGHRSRRNRFGK